MGNQSTSSPMSAVDPVSSATVPRDPGVDLICKALKGIRFGEVRVIVQDGLIVQIERLEKQRLR